MFGEHFEFSETVAHASILFQDRWDSMRFKVFESPRKVNSLLCPDRNDYQAHVPAIVHRTGKASAEVINTCGVCGSVIGNWYGYWAELDGWSERKLRDGGRME